jgi:hypothetical protein
LHDDKINVVERTCDKSVEFNNLAASCHQAVDNLSTSWGQAVRTHPVDKLLEQHCYKSAVGLLQKIVTNVTKMVLNESSPIVSSKMGKVSLCSEFQKGGSRKTEKQLSIWYASTPWFSRICISITELLCSSML